MTRTVAPYGSWRSPITAGALVADSLRLSSVSVDGDDVYWVEGRPSEGGRQVLVRWRGGTIEDMSALGDNVRTLAHEYGGRSYAVRDGLVVWSSFADQRLHVIGTDEPITPEPPLPRSVRFADHELSADGRWVLCVRERHEVPGATEAVNDLVAIATDVTSGITSINLIADGHDFFSSPRLSPDGRRLAWLSWDHPNMPWDATELWVANVDLDRDVIDVGRPRRVAGGPGESVSEPRWSLDGVLHWVSDRTGWWNLYDEHARSGGGPLVEMDADFASPEWVFGNRSYAFLGDGTLFASWWSEGVKRFGAVASDAGKIVELDLPFTTGGSIVGAGNGAVVGVFASPRQAPAVVRVDVTDGSFEVLRSSAGSSTLDEAYVSVPQSIEFPSEGGRTAHALFYPPTNPEFEGAEGVSPPLIVLSHGGPTSQATADLDARILYWTSRGVAVVDVNYGGSTGYGRAYRERLKGAWGVTDVDDCVNAAKWLAEQGLVDGSRLVIRGGSAGGYTTLAALAFRPGVFAAGSTHYGVADLEALARDMHKFESRYTDGLVAPYPSGAAVYRERSPIHHTDRLSCPVILFQGLEDMVVPPDQAEMMVAALDAKGIPHAYVPFEGEQHGFRQASTIVRVAESELYFLGRVLRFTPADELPPVRIAHEDALGR